MRTVVCAALAFCGACSNASFITKTHVPIFKAEGKFEVQHFEQVLQSAGYVNFPGSGSGTAVCVAPKVILTAAHVPYNEKTLSISPSGTLTMFHLDTSGVFLEEDIRTEITLIHYDLVNDLRSLGLKIPPMPAYHSPYQYIRLVMEISHIDLDSIRAGSGLLEFI